LVNRAPGATILLRISSAICSWSSSTTILGAVWCRVGAPERHASSFNLMRCQLCASMKGTPYL
jgi:hypothetical protein